MPLEVYKLIHIIGIFLILVPLGGIILHVMNGGTRNYPNRKFAAITHGIGMVLTLVAGFGMLARLGIMSSLPVWVIIKLLFWFNLGVLPFFAYRNHARAKYYWMMTIVISGLAAFLAVFKPF